MNDHLIAYLQRIPTKLAVQLSMLYCCIFQPVTSLAQGNCTMEQHVVDSWTATVQGDQEAIRKLDDSGLSGESKLEALKTLNASYQKDIQRLHSAKLRLDDCLKHAQGIAPKPLPAVQSSFRNREWKIEGLGILTLSQPDLGSPTIAGTLLVQTGSLEGIPESTEVKVKGSLQGDGFKVIGTAPLTAGSYLALRKKEITSYGYTLSIEAQFKDPRMRDSLVGTASLTKFEQYRHDKGTVLKSLEIQGGHVTPPVLVAGSIAFQNFKMARPKSIDKPYKFMGVYSDSGTIFSFEPESPDKAVPESGFLWSLSWPGVASSGRIQPVKFSSSGWQTAQVTLDTTTSEAKVLVMDKPWGLGEKWYAGLYPVESVIAYTLALIRPNPQEMEPVKWAQQNFPGDQIHNGKGDAARHTYWNCLLTIYIGPGYAEGITTQHEVSSPGPATETVMDLYNNAVGRSLGVTLLGKLFRLEVPNNTSCQNSVYNAISEGIPVYLDSCYGNQLDDKEQALLLHTNQPEEIDKCPKKAQ